MILRPRKTTVVNTWSSQRDTEFLHRVIIQYFLWLVDDQNQSKEMSGFSFHRMNLPNRSSHKRVLKSRLKKKCAWRNIDFLHIPPMRCTIRSTLFVSSLDVFEDQIPRLQIMCSGGRVGASLRAELVQLSLSEWNRISYFEMDFRRAITLSISSRIWIILSAADFSSSLPSFTSLITTLSSCCNSANFWFVYCIRVSGNIITVDWPVFQLTLKDRQSGKVFARTRLHLFA